MRAGPRQGGFGLGPRRGGLFNQGVADIDGGQPCGFVEGRFKGEDAEEQVVGLCHTVDAPTAPDPHLGRNVVHGSHAQRLHLFGKGDVEGVVVKRNQHIGFPRLGKAHHVLHHLLKVTNLGEHFKDPHRAQRVGVVE